MVDNSRPIDNAVPARDMVSQNVKRVQAATATASDQTRAQSSPANVAASVKDASRLLEAARAEVSQADQQTVAQLKAAIADGTYDIDFDALADRMIGDALGEE